MKILFVENRQKTWFWDAVAARLEVLGNEIHWVLQNPVFRGRTGRAHRIRIPHGSAAAQPADAWFAEIVASDRHITTFGGTSAHYVYYRDQLANVLDRVKPDVVIGEATLFHELILAKLCRERSVEYLHPMAARYPEARFFALRYDTQEALAESGDAIPDAQARQMAQAIGRRATVPFYMRRPLALGAIRKEISLRLGHVRLLLGWILGERFNTPSPLRRVSMTLALRRRLAQWDALARPIEAGCRAILYPLQMQPECNIDVLGRGMNDQTALVAELLRRAPADVCVAVKGNPKARHEVTDGLLDLASKGRRLILLPRAMSMAEAQACTLGSLTVTGTVGFEALFGAARCFSLMHPLVTREFPSFHARDVANAVDLLLASPEKGKGSSELGARLIRRLVQQSFPGLVSDPTSHPHVMHRENVLTVAESLAKALALGESVVVSPGVVATGFHQ